MKRKKATQIIHNALVGYVEDCAGENTPEANEIQEAWDLIREPSLTPEEIDNLKIIRDSLEPTSDLFKTLDKVMKGISISK